MTVKHSVPTGQEVRTGLGRSTKVPARSFAYRLLSTVAIAVLAIATAREAVAVNAERARQAVKEGLAAVERGERNTAVTQFRKAVDNDPGNGEAQFNLATSLTRIGDLAEVEQHLLAAREAGYDEAEVDAALAEFYVQTGKFGKVLNDFPEGHRRTDLESRIRTARGYAQLNLRQNSDAERAFAQGIARAKVGLAQTRIIAGNLAEATTLLDEAVAEDPTFVDPWILLGRVRALRNDLSGARAAFDAALKLDPNSLLALLGRATIVIDSDENQATQDIAAALDQAPDNWQANLLDATIKARHQQWREAEAALMTIPAPEAMPQALYLLARVNLAQGQLNQADANITHFLAIVPNDPKGVAIKAQVLMLRGKPSGAVDLLQQALAIKPNDISLLGLLSDAYTRNRQYKEAAEVLDRVSAIAPRDPGLRVQLAEHRIAVGQLDSALQDLAIAQAAEPLSPKATSLTLQALIAANRLDDAAKTAEDFRHDNQDSPLSETYLGLIDIKRNDLPAAREHFTKALALQPSFAIAAVDMAQAYRLEKRVDDARAALDRFLDKNPTNITGLMARAEIEVAEGKSDVAIEFLERARSSDPQAVQPRLNLVSAYIQRNDPAKAVAIARELETIAPGDARCIAALAEAQLANKDRDTAIRTYQRLIEMTDGAPEPQIRLADILASADVQAGYRVMRQALENNPTDERVQRAFSAFSVKHDMAGAGIDLVRNLAERRPDEPRLNLLLGQLYETDRHFQRAVSAYEAGFAKQPTSEFVLGIARSEARGPKPETALPTLSDWLAKQPDDNAARYLYANLLTDAKQFNQAIAEWRRLLSGDPKNPVMLNNLAWVYFLSADSRALSTAEEAYAQAPNSAAIAGTLGWIVVESGNDLPRGLKLLRQAAEGAAPSPIVRYHLAVALSRSGLREEALQVLTALVESGAQFDELAAAQALIAKLRS
jgi:putative PEP-CTERM system TPR-repeat lipoprotein